ncbi:copper chaperone PCu(A)C [Leptothrix sp. BB-4]
MTSLKSLALTAALGLSLLAGAAQAQTPSVQAKDAWVRPTIGMQRVTGVFMTLTAGSDLKLVGASSPDARVVEVHEMAMEGDVMKMRAVPALDLPAGKAVELKPGGYHLMLIDVARPVKAGTSVTLDLEVEDKAQKRSRVTVQAVARPMGAAGGGHDGHAGH